MSISIKSGLWLFITISLDTNYVPSEAMQLLLRKIFPEYQYCVIETGENGKKHLHTVGNTTRRPDNVKLSIRKLLEKENYDLTVYSID